MSEVNLIRRLRDEPCSIELERGLDVATMHIWNDLCSVAADEIERLEYRVRALINGEQEAKNEAEIERLRMVLPEVWDAGFSFACQNSCAGVRDNDQTDYRQRDIDAVLEDAK